MTLEAIEIKRIMPQRNPMLLVDGVCPDNGDGPLRAYKNITINEPCFRHADDATTMDQFAYPLSLLVESFGQASGLLLSRNGFLDKAQSSHVIVFGEFRGIDILGYAYPGDRLVHEVAIEYSGSQMATFSGRTLVGERPIVTFEKIKAFLVPKESLPRQASAGLGHAS